MTSWVVVAVGAAIYHLCMAKVEVKITFRSFDNTKPMILANEKCCDSSLLSFIRCDQVCDPSIVVCITTVVGECNEYKGRTGVYMDAEHVDLLNNMGQIKNPLSITMEDWKRDLTFQLDINDYRDGGDDQPMDKIEYTYRTPKLSPHGQGTFIRKDLHGNNVILSLEIAAECSLHFYGPSCSEYCNVHNVFGGHYRCSKEGKLVCQTGYSGTKCNNYLGACESSPCMNNATCRARSGGHFKCYCTRHYSGGRCEVPVGSKPSSTLSVSTPQHVLPTTATTATTATVSPRDSSTRTTVQTDVQNFQVGNFHTCNETLDLSMNIGPGTPELGRAISTYVNQYKRSASRDVTVMEEKSNTWRLTVKSHDDVPVNSTAVIRQILELIGNRPIIFNVTCSHPYVTAEQEESESITGVIVGATVGVALTTGFVMTRYWGSKPTDFKGNSSSSPEDNEKRVLEMLQESKDTIASSPPICSTVD